MKGRIILWAHGRDRSGIVAAVTKVLFRQGFNLEDTSMTILEGHFAMIVVASLSSPAAGTDLKKLETLLLSETRGLGLRFFLQPFSAAAAKPQKAGAQGTRALITVFGMDRAGIVYRVADFLARRRVNILDATSHITGSRTRPIYAMVVETELPPKLNPETLSRALKSLQTRLKTEIRLTPVQSGTL